MPGSSVFGPYARYLEFCSAFGPVLIGHVMVPTLAAACRRETVSLVSLPLSRSTLETHFVYSREAVRAGRWWTALSYMFCHADWSHLSSNAQGLLLSGPAALDALGRAGAVATYLIAGVLGALDVLRIYDLQLERLFSSGWRAVRREVDRFVSSSSADSLLAALPRRETKAVTDLASESWNYATRALDGAAARLATSLATDLAKARRLIGASAGVSAFLAVDACASLEKCANVLRAPHDLSLEAVTILLHALGATRYFAAEASRAWTGAAPGVDHAAHLSGAAVGILAFALARASHYFANRRRPRRAPRTSPAEDHLDPEDDDFPAASHHLR